MYSDSPEEAIANSRYLTIVEMANAYELNLYGYFQLLFANRPSKSLTSEEVQTFYKNKAE